MAFNFNWSPLIADTYRVREMLTTALNKSPRPPIIVDDIVVTELNLGETPPDLEILEIGDLAEDRFRGIFKMAYSGDAFLTLKTRVQANPLNTYLTTKPTFTSPQPLAAASGLTIPLQITLSEFRLSGFVILVFSRQKGLTIVFRNDPLESLKVSSTFDSIPFVRDYLQRTIEEQLRTLFMEDLPAILHKLSLRLWTPDYCEEYSSPPNPDAKPMNPLAQELEFGDEDSGVEIELESPTETQATFSQKNLLRLAALSQSHRTLSLFTPSIRDAVFRAWATASEPRSGTHTPLPTLSRLGSTYSSAAASVASGDSFDTESLSRGVLSRSSSYHTFGGTNRHRKRKKRVINLRQPITSDMPEGIVSAPISTETTPEGTEYAHSAPSVILEERDEDLPNIAAVLERSPGKTIRRVRSRSVGQSRVSGTAKEKDDRGSEQEDGEDRLPPPAYTPPSQPFFGARTAEKRPFRLVTQQRSYTSAPSSASTGSFPLLRSLSSDKLTRLNGGAGGVGGSEYSFASGSGSSGGILEQAWIQKMAREIARKVREEKERLERMEREVFQGVREGKRSPRDVGLGEGMEAADAPPAYGV